MVNDVDNFGGCGNPAIRTLRFGARFELRGADVWRVMWVVQISFLQDKSLRSPAEPRRDDLSYKGANASAICCRAEALGLGEM